MNRLLTLISVFGYVSLVTCGVYEGARDKDGTKLMLVFMWLVTYITYILWKRRAIETSAEWMKSVTRYNQQLRKIRLATPPESAPGANLVDHDDGGKTEAESTKNIEG